MMLFAAALDQDDFGDMNGPLGYWGPAAPQRPAPQGGRATQPAARPLRLDSAIAVLKALMTRARAA
jgi:hypothetical protein